MSKLIACRSLLCLALGLASAFSAWAAPTYVFTAIDYPGASTTLLFGLNNAGQLAGLTQVGGEAFGFVYGGGFAPVPPPPTSVWPYTTAYGVNDAGVVVGAVSDYAGVRAGFILNGGAYTYFSKVGSTSLEARAIGPSGLITGQYVETATSHTNGYIYDPGPAAFTDITYPGSTVVIASGINASGLSVGSLNQPGIGGFGYVRDTAGIITPFQVSGGFTRARGVNDAGLVSGYFGPAGSGPYTSFVGNAALGYQSLSMPGAVNTAAYGVNNAGQVVGNWAGADGINHGFIASPAILPIGTTAGGAFLFSTPVIANTPLFIDPVIATGYDYAIGAGDPNFATVRLPIGIGDSRYTLTVGGNSYPLAGGVLFDFRTHGFPGGVGAFRVSDIKAKALLDPANGQAFVTELTFMADGNFTGTQAPLTANTFVVTNTNDAGAGSLRAAVALANGAAPPNVITFDPGVTGTIVLNSGTIIINAGPLTILGPGAGVLTIDGNANDRIFLVADTGSTTCPALTGPNDFLVTISGLTLANAHRNTDNTGGAISSFHSLSVDSVVIRDNQAKAGAGISFLTQFNGQALTITNSTFSNNIAKPTPVATSDQQGGALRVAVNCTGTRAPTTVTIANSTFTGNSAQPTGLNARGGAIGILSYADVAISDTRIVDNHALAPNPTVAGMTYYAGGIFASNIKSLTIDRSEISNNSAFDATGSDQTRGGGLFMSQNASDLQAPADATVLRIVNSTISGNSVSATAGAMVVFGNVAVELDNSTIVNNTAAPTRTGGITLSTGATSPPTANNASTPTLRLVSSILARNSSTAGDVSTNTTTIPTFTVDSTNSLIQTVCATCSITVSGAGNVLATDPVIGPLAFNGGTSRTHALLAGSPALNAGSNPLSLTTDQRGPLFARVIGGIADMGALESNGIAAPSLVSAKSRKVHGTAGTFDLALSLIATGPSTESRTGPAQTIVMTFD
ncbi:MAG TPA: right-handed parallel beta-helix repeat-containing protein, partial [Casimicrobiaceae bacterium]|nr:right-handed parallel beta-helix repeat-containing protein [Casimicrobiaceae bacterium]